MSADARGTGSDVVERLEYEMWVEDPKGLTLTHEEVVGNNRVMADAADEIRRLREQLAARPSEQELKVLRMKADAHDRLPFCPDHRDKVAGKPCRECEVERLAALPAAPEAP